MRDSLNDTHKWMRYSNTENLFISEFALVFSSVDEILGGMIMVFWNVTLYFHFVTVQKIPEYTIYCILCSGFCLLHKMQYNIIKNLKTEMENENITVMKADKSKAIILIDKDKRHEKVMQFIHDNNIPQIKTDPTTKFQKQTQQAIQQCKQMINKQKKYTSI